ncbi:VWA domain-containing protein [Candidatus Woesearchaeota archaeon]|nr:VWA domain-containing protein [Candidatus Woesearchaeota archaeon]
MGNSNKLWSNIIISMIIIIIFSVSAYAQVTVFNGGSSEISLSYETAYLTRNFFVSIPNGTVTEARMVIEGLDLLGNSIQPADVILVTDVSGSMDDDCHCLDGSPSDDGYCPYYLRPYSIDDPCKINDAKTAAIEFLNNVNLNAIHVGLVNYSTCPRDPQNVLQLTSDRTILENIINHYSTEQFTNIGGGIELAMHELMSSRAQPGTPKYIIVMTDGLANYRYNRLGYYDGGSCLGGTDRASIAAATGYTINISDLAEANGITIYGIAFGEADDVNLTLVQRITTNGLLYHAPDAATLAQIYSEIAQSISVQDFPTPRINSTSPLNIFGWRYPSQLAMSSQWDGSSCGASSATCSDFRSLVQSNLDVCSSDPCDIQFSAHSTTVGMLTLSDLYIEINEPPAPINLPPSGVCQEGSIFCGQSTYLVNIDDEEEALVTDPNDDLDTLSWTFHHSTESAGGAYIDMNSDFDTSRQLIFTVDPAHTEETFWEVFYFNVTDPWGETTTACINISYYGCLAGNPVLDISDRTIEFDISYYPSGRLYDLHDMIDIPPTADLPCSMDELGYIISDSENFRVIGPNDAGEIIVIPKNPETNLPDWYSPTSENLDVTIYCVDESLGGTEDITIYGNGDVILVTDFSGSMKKDVDSWREGTSVGSQYSDCLTRTYFEDDTRKTHIARCLDSELAEIVLSYENNRVWPLFIMRDEIMSYGGDPQDLSAILDYLFNYPQGMDQTCLSCAINEGYDILNQNSGEDRVKFIVLMTDGVPTHCAEGSCVSISSIFGEEMCAGFCDTQGQNYCDEDDYYYGGIGGCLLDDEGCSQAEVNTMFSAGRAIQDLNVIFYTISFGLIENCPRSEYLMRPIAEMNDGVYNHSSNVDKLREIYQEIGYRILELTRVSSEYSITGAINDSAVLTINYVAPSGANCGNGVVDSGEQCDDMNDDNSDECSNICRWTFCNDGTVQQPNGRDSLLEECDDGNTFDGDSCNNQCISQYCGDGIAQPGLGEQCDNGFGYFNDECLENCMRGVPEPPRCGDNSSDVGEECDDGCRRGNPVLCELADNGDGCDQFCMLEEEPVLLLDDTTISFDYSYFPIGYYEYLLESMVSRRYATLPCSDDSLQFSMSSSVNFSITGPDITDPLGKIHIVPDNPDWSESTSQEHIVSVSCWESGEEHTNEANLMIIYTGEGAPNGNIDCVLPIPRYLLHSGSQVEIGLDEIFDFEGDYGNINDFREGSSDRIIITSDLGGSPGNSRIFARSVGFGPVFETVPVRVFTDNGVYSRYCPVTFFDMNSNCDKDECTTCINNRDLACFVAHDCLAESPIIVLNPFTPVRASRYVPASAPLSYEADFEPLPGSGFRIEPLSGSGSNEIFNVTGIGLTHGTRNASVMAYTFNGFVGSTRVCPMLVRLEYTIGEESQDPITDLLITGSRAITGFYEWGGLRSKGPFIFTSKVWLR